MAEFINPIGKIRGKFGNVIAYVGANGKNYCKSIALTHKPGEEPQKRYFAAFGTVVQKKRWLAKAIRLGFPGGGGYPKGFNGFTSANVTDVVMVEKIKPEKPLSRRKKATQEFRGIVDYKKLRVAAGSLVSPLVSIEVNGKERKVLFNYTGIQMEAVDCFGDDKIYGVILYEPKHVCYVTELGTRGETVNVSVDFPQKVKEDGLIVYVFATSANGKDASDSVCLREPITEMK